ncbi:NAD(P)-dependent alcohol dehydrogenase [Rhodohalobacter sp. 614A]|uniref:NAD(P)-dependent alcohol dehydrogenase n=1 Tax=Rhodohalobacter sp. 614A TaxID=2908649 RepID=UPI001F3EB3B2|nr:NAD(P)-dependent alcohol dehydrogenase [Rhodohalobacter sp. 614A]
MKAIVCTKYGGPEVLQLKEVEKPIPKENELLVRVHSASVTRADGMMRKGEPLYGRIFLGFTKPKHPIPGTGFAGVVEAVGSEVKHFKTGEKVFGELGVNFGGNAEYVCIAEDDLVMNIPPDMGFEEAAPICDGALTGMNFLKNIGKIKKGQRVLVNGASGGLGTSGIQLAKVFGAEVTGVCSTSNVEFVKELGADHVIDYKKEDFTKYGEEWDIIYDTIGKSSFSSCKGVLSENGAYICPVLGMPLLFQMMRTSLAGKKKAKFSATGLMPVPELKKMLKELIVLFKEGKVKTMIDRRYSLEETADAHRYIDKGHKKGNAVINIHS